MSTPIAIGSVCDINQITIENKEYIPKYILLMNELKKESGEDDVPLEF